jgi:hypothetical protein
VTIVATPAPAEQPFTPRLHAVLRTSVGRLAMVAAGTVMLAGMQVPYWYLIGLVLVATALLPAHRKRLLVLAAIGWVFLFPAADPKFLAELGAPYGAQGWARAWPVGIVAAWGLAFGYLALVQRFPRSQPARHPLIGLLLVLFGLMTVSRVPMPGPPRVLVAATAMAFSSYLWFFAFWIVENVQRDKARPVLRTFAWRPFWGFTSVPFGKGAAYLEKMEAKDDEQLAVSQLKGLKLLAYAVVWTALLISLKWLLLGPTESLTKIPYYAPHARVPTYPMALDAMIQGHSYPWHMRWAALAGHFWLWVIGFVIFGHKVVAVARLAGFNIFRNTYYPFGATSVADFYNRIYYYFKELLVAFFFYPTYLRYFKKHPKVRLFAATLMAAGWGNFLFHFLREQERMLRFGVWDTLVYYRSYAVYALVLGVAIAVSQMRVLNRKGKEPTGVWRWAAIASMLMFYCLINVIREPNEQHGLAEYGRFFVSLFRP